MTKTINNEYNIWIKKAHDDLKWTEANMREKIFYGACFTSQQAVEKILKAFLLYKIGKFDKVHDLVSLIDKCIEIDSNFNSFRKPIAKLSFYYIQSRYPDISEIDIFSKEEAENAFVIAKKIVEFTVTKILPQ
jgi:HEPN domain-containing protein